MNADDPKPGVAFRIDRGRSAPKPDYLIWWTSQSDCERVTPLDTWPMYLYNEFRSRDGRNGRGRLWVSPDLRDAPDGVEVWDDINNWLCQIANDAGGIVIRTADVRQVLFHPGFITTFEMALPESLPSGTL